jgi:hypothetical protein
VFYGASHVGWELRVGDASFTPYVGGGILAVFASAGGESASATSPLVVPGASIRYDVPSTPLTVGADARVLYVTATGDAALGFFAAAGARF